MTQQSNGVRVYKRGDFDKIKTTFIKAADEATLTKELGFALMMINKNQLLQKCSPESIQEAVLNIAMTGLSLNPALKYAYMIPRFVRDKGWTACLEPSYQGLVKLITDQGLVNSVQCYLVREGDQFTYRLGTDPDIEHLPQLGNSDKEVLGAYAVAYLKTGEKQVEVMDHLEIKAIRDTSESYKHYVKKGEKGSTIWVDHFGEMARKTVIKRLVKYLNKSEGHENIAKAVELTDQDFKASIYQLEKINQLMTKANILESQKEELLSEMHTFTPSRAQEVIKKLQECQVDVAQHANEAELADHVAQIAQTDQSDQTPENDKEIEIIEQIMSCQTLSAITKLKKETPPAWLTLGSIKKALSDQEKEIRASLADK